MLPSANPRLRSDFYTSCPPAPGKGVPLLTWNGCYSRTAAGGQLPFADGLPVWSSGVGSNIGSLRVAEGSVTVGGGCYGPSTSGAITVANGTVLARGEDLHFETAMEPQWVSACCPHSGRISMADFDRL